MLKTIFWIWLVLTIAGLVYEQKEKKSEGAISKIKFHFKAKPVSTAIVLIIAILLVSGFFSKFDNENEKISQHDEATQINTIAKKVAVPESNAVTKVEAVKVVSEMGSKQGNTQNTFRRVGTDEYDYEDDEYDYEDDEYGYGDDEYDYEDDGYDYGEDEYDYGIDEYGVANNGIQDINAENNPSIWSSEYLFEYLKSHDFYAIDNLVEVAEKFWEKKSELEANSEPVYLKVNKKAFGENYFSLTSGISEYQYIGELKDNKPSGFGVLSTVSWMAGVFQVSYCGNFKDGRFDGTGIMMQQYDDDVVANVIDAAAEGNPIIQDADSYLETISYIGSFSKGKQTGIAVLLTYPDLGEYVDLLVAYSDYEAATEFLNENGDISVQIGTNKDGVLDGDDCYVYYHGYLLYKGGIKDGTMSGKGTAYFPDTEQIRYEGHWKNGKYDGEGTLYDENGEIVYAGEWENGDYAS